MVSLLLRPGRAAAPLALVFAVALAAPASANHYDDLLAPESACPGQTDLAAGPGAQRATMRCLHGYARSQTGAARLASRARTSANAKKLNSSAQHKARDLMRCGVFSHSACNRDFTYWIRRVGYAKGCWGAGENIAWGSGRLGSARSIMSAWLHSDGHRNNVLGSRYRHLGVGLVQGDYQGYEGAQVWVAHFGCRC